MFCAVCLSNQIVHIVQGLTEKCIKEKDKTVNLIYNGQQSLPMAEILYLAQVYEFC